MLFNSYVFVLLFLPLSVLGFLGFARWGHRHLAIGWLVLASLFFYGWWNPPYLGLILGSILFNYTVGLVLARPGLPRKALLVLGVAVNLSLLGYFKYANFFVNNLNAAAGTHLHLAPIVLPLAISFFTFQQITYLVDSFRGETHEYNFLHYCLFVTFFPQLIAGPIVHHREMLPQFKRDEIYRFHHDSLAVGLTIFIFGLFRKVVLADTLALYATPVFTLAREGGVPTFFEAWGGVLAYTFQLYFDFSGYSDMAIGLGAMLGIRLPMNFNSPYKATSIIDFWRRWHMTLSRFLHEYVYIPLGGNRRGRPRRYVNLMVTMLLGGLWHGAGWTFVLWGALHGVYLVINHAWRALRRGRQGGGLGARVTSRGLTFLAAVLGWVFFRAESFPAAMRMLKSMAGEAGISLPYALREHLGSIPGLGFGGMFYHRLANWDAGIFWLLAAGAIVWFTPNTQRLMHRFNPAFETYRGGEHDAQARWLHWRPSVGWALLTAVLAVWSLIKMSSVSEFLYYQF